MLFLVATIVSACGGGNSNTDGPRIPGVGGNVFVDPTSATVAPGASITLHSWGQCGEVVPPRIVWSIREGAAGGSLVVDSTAGGVAGTVVIYTAPAAAGGPFHVVATNCGDPALTAVVTIN
jgi:hypothetical protein